jgi:integrase
MTIRRQRPIEPLTEGEIEALALAAPRHSTTGARARALVSLLAYGGLRIGEALALRPQDVDLDAGTINVLRGKGGKQRVVAFLPEGRLHVERWLRRRQAVGVNGSAPLLCTISSGRNTNGRAPMRPGGPLAVEYAQQLLVRLAARAGIPRRVHPHGLRHSHAHLLASRGHLITDIRDQLGHVSLDTTSRYLDSFAPAGRVARLNGSTNGAASATQERSP